jgi:diguanylate cyclase (GGDEF)-like protein
MADSTVPTEINVLLIDEDREYASALDQLLEKQGLTRFKPAHASTLRNAIEQLQSKSYQVILLDLSLPDGAGMGAFIEISSTVPDTPVVVMADHDDRHLALELLRQGAQDFLVKEEVEAELLERALLFAIERNRIHLALQQQSLVDELTGLLNRRGFLSLAQGQIKIAERENWGLLLFFADLDKLKRINDRLGHLEGDRALKTVAQVLTRTFRASDLVARLGGDEFVVLAFQAPAESVKGLTARLQENLDEYLAQDTRLPLSLSCGAALSEPGKKVDLEALIARADEDLYLHKHRKRRKTT